MKEKTYVILTGSTPGKSTTILPHMFHEPRKPRPKAYRGQLSRNAKAAFRRRVKLKRELKRMTRAIQEAATTKRYTKKGGGWSVEKVTA